VCSAQHQAGCLEFQKVARFNDACRSDNDLLVLACRRHTPHTHLRDYEAQSLGLTRAQLNHPGTTERQPDVFAETELAGSADVTAATIARLIDRLEVLGWSSAAMIREDRRIWPLGA